MAVCAVVRRVLEAVNEIAHSLHETITYTRPTVQDVENVKNIQQIVRTGVLSLVGESVGLNLTSEQLRVAQDAFQCGNGPAPRGNEPLSFSATAQPQASGYWIPPEAARARSSTASTRAPRARPISISHIALQGKWQRKWATGGLGEGAGESGAELLVGLVNVVHEMQLVGARGDYHLLGPGGAAVELVRAARPVGSACKGSWRESLRGMTASTDSTNSRPVAFCTSLSFIG